MRSRFEGQRWALPARVYARPLELYEGMALSAEAFAAELTLARYREDPSLRFPGSYDRKGKTFLVHTRPFTFWDGRETAARLRIAFADERIDKLSDIGAGPAPSLVRLPPALIASIYPLDNEDRTLVRLKEIPQALINALLAVEDRAFFEHRGIAFKSIVRALLANLRAGSLVQGGSTLTQQLAKNFFLTPERSLTRKINEASIALLLEQRYDKNEILEAYLNEVYLGQHGSRAIHGFGLGSQFYFDRPLNELRLDQLALLVAVIRGPSYYNPRRNPQRARVRRDLVLDAMVKLGSLSAEQAVKAKVEPLGVTTQVSVAASRYPDFLDLVRRQLRRDYRLEDLRSEGLRIFTTLDPQVQQAAQQALAKGLAALEKNKPKTASELQGAAIVTSREDGEILAATGGRDSRNSGFNRALDAVRPIGSLIKPAVYLAALSKPDRYTLVSRLNDGRLRLRGKDGSTWAPSNYDGAFHGVVALHTALANSYNPATVRLGMDVGVDTVLVTLRDLGLLRPLEAYPSLLLGAAELAPVEVAQLYQTLAGGGFYAPLRAIREVLDRDGRPLQRYPLTVRQTVDPAAVYLVNTALQEAARTGTGRSMYQRLPKSLSVAGKTGTTNDLRDSWFAGFTGDRVAVVWVGRDDNRPTGLSGASGALRLWVDIVRRTHPQSLQLVPPADVERVQIDPISGLRADRNCDGAVAVPFIQGSAPNNPAPCSTTLRASGKESWQWLKRIFR